MTSPPPDPAPPPRPLRVGLNLMFLGPRAGGVGRYGAELAPALLAAEPDTEITVFTGRDAPPQLRSSAWADTVRIRTLPVAAGSPQSQLAQFTLLPGLAAAGRLDVLHSPGNTGPGLTPRVASVVSLMDLIWHHHADEWNPDPAAQRAMRRWVAASLRFADRVLTITEAARREIVAELGVAADRVGVTHLGVRAPDVAPAPEVDVRRRLELGAARVLLCVAQKRPYKRLDVLVRALPTLPDDVRLVLPGSPTSYERELRDLAAALGVADRVRFPDWVSEAELAALYRLAAGVALPSAAEGFGLPVLEAMLAGTPVACSDIPALREISGEAALHFDPDDPTAAAEALRRLVGDEPLRERLRSRGRDQAARFSWRATGEATLAGYRTAIAARTGRA
jgi:glycosyltransferase involved in cell wall biosynthesis